LSGSPAGSTEDRKADLLDDMSSPVQLGWTRQLEMAATNPFQEDTMAQGLQRMRLNPPPTRKWVTFQDWDEEALEYKESVRRHSGLDITNLSTTSASPLGTPPQASLSASSVTASSSAMSVPSPPPGSPDTISPLGSPTRYSAFNELIEQEKKTAELSYGDTYAALEALRQEEGGAYLGWSNQILGNSFGWSETIKGETRPAPPDTLPLGAPSHPNHLLPSSSELCPEVSVETQSTPEMTGLRTISWPRSPTRTFVRNFP